MKLLTKTLQLLRMRCSHRALSQVPELSRRSNDGTDIQTLCDRWALKLEQNGVSEPRHSAELNCTCVWEENGQIILQIHELSPHISVEKEKEAKIDHLCQHRLKSKPVPYIIGEWDFHDLVLKMKEPVFIPRPETEDLADYVCDSIEQNGLQTGRLLDMCCGSGALAIHILNRFKEMRGISIDKLTEACDLTKENAEHHLIHDRLSVLQHDLFNEDLLNHLNPYLPFDIIVSNPPYIPTKNLKNLQPEILRYESQEALDGGEDGMDAIRRIVDLAPRLMDSEGQVWLEVDLGEPEMIEDMLCQNSKVVFLKTLPDFTKRNRFCVLQVK